MREALPPHERAGRSLRHAHGFVCGASYPTAPLCPATTGETGLPREKMVVWRKEVEDLIGLEEAYKIEAETVEH